MVRPAANLKPATYRCPFCEEHLPSLMAHMLVSPEGDTRRRRHAHTECVLAEKRGGRGADSNPFPLVDSNRTRSCNVRHEALPWSTA